MEDRGFAEQDLRPEELVALQVLLKLSRLCGGHGDSWGRKRRRSAAAYFSCNFEGKRAASPPAAMAAEAAVGVKPGRSSPTTPLRRSGDERFSATASPSSDCAAGPRPCDLNLEPNVKSKVQVQRKLGVHNPSNGKGSKKKLKELLIGLSSEREEMEKEKKKLFNSFQSLTDENELLKQKLALKLSIKRQRQLDVSIGHDALESSLCGFGVPDLNIPAEDVEDLYNDMPIYFDSQVANVTSKAVVAAKARKYRMECLRLKHSQSVKAHLRWH
ncbi:uncharacterized protein LOC131045266 isoform X2 [Cryptomeria japonica]|uniref:uncharacterized protein LOC131045266 isoform X2 n=1 Tax=Cryptomeria japonica TaxID=3369 RepID=UPI0027DA68B1|nr:uncharacterized protein LOC131045266 isoform X2 [Cryptomeria japonica]